MAAPEGSAQRPRSHVLMDEYDRAVAAGDDAAADRLLREATFAATQDGTAPDGVTFNPATGQMEDLTLRQDPTLFGGRTGAAMQGAGQGLSFGAMDEVVGALHGLTGPGSYAENSAYARDVMRDDLARARDEHPVVAYGAEIAGGAASSIGAASALGMTGAGTLGAQARQGAALGAAEGAVYGGMSAEGGAAERAAGAAKGAGIGGLTGFAAPYAIEGARRGFDTLVGGPVASMRSAPSQVRASRAVQTAVDRSGRSVDEIEAGIRNAHAAGQTGYAIADATGYSGQRMLAGAARTPGDGRQEIVEFLTRRQDGQGRRIAGALDDALNAPRNPQNLPAVPGGQAPKDFRGATADAVRDRLTRARNTVADAAYEAARRDAGPVDVRNALSVIDERIAPMQGSGIAGDGIDAKLTRYRSRLAAQPGGEAYPGASSVELSDFNRILGVKQDIADDIGAAVRAGRNYEARTLMQLKDALDQALEGASGAYREANDGFARASRVIDQIDAGKAATSPRARVADTLGHYRAQTPEGQAAFRAGYTDPLMAKIENSAPGVNKARPFLSDGATEELRAMAKDPDDLLSFLQRENTMFQTANAASGGSMTADNLADSADVLTRGSSAVGNLLTGNFVGAARQIADGVMNTLSGRNTATREEIARMLLSGDIRDVLAPAIERELQNALRSAYGEAAIRSLERTTNPL
ncbi:hypothetical protein [Paracoccus sp. SY]|uniref:hypothetical protein n=1 Tax=Paracoccus sp. SY TaxID=1330255 RepID=UPI0011AF472B|nr:hypothetical protein [Paracoccus sp. SY]